MTKSKVDYNCSKCPGYCCTYPRIVVTDKDIARLANHFGISEDAARLRYTRQYEFESDDPDEYVNERILKHRKDHIYKTSCMFLDPEARRCTIYEGRPSVCREFPNGKKMRLLRVSQIRTQAPGRQGIYSERLMIALCNRTI